MGKAQRRNWTIDKAKAILSMNGKEFTFDMSTATDEARLFAQAYGYKQLFADSTVNAKDATEALECMKAKADLFGNEKAKIVRTDKGFTYRDPNEVRTFGSRIPEPVKNAREEWEGMSKTERTLVEKLFDKKYMAYIKGESDSI